MWVSQRSTQVSEAVRPLPGDGRGWEGLPQLDMAFVLTAGLWCSRRPVQQAQSAAQDRKTMTWRKKGLRSHVVGLGWDLGLKAQTSSRTLRGLLQAD